MLMKLRYLIFVIVVMCSVLCCTKDDDTLEKQREGIERFLTSSHVPRLIWLEDIETSLDPEPQFYEKLELDTYRYIATYYQEDRLSKEEVIEGSIVELILTGYIFENGVPKIENVFYSNDAEIIAQMAQDGLNTEYWTTDPKVLHLGNDRIIKGLEISLYGCREGDVVEAYSTMTDGYGSEDMGVVPSKSMVMWSYTILSVKNQ